MNLKIEDFLNETLQRLQKYPIAKKKKKIEGKYGYLIPHLQKPKFDSILSTKKYIFLLKSTHNVHILFNEPKKDETFLEFFDNKSSVKLFSY